MSKLENVAKEINIEHLSMMLVQSWCKETACGEWAPENPSMNQCAVTALVIQDLHGGDILRCTMTDGDSHYWNCIKDIHYDFTVDQFDNIEPKPLRNTAEVRTRQYILSYPTTMFRYGILLQRLSKVME